MLASLRRVLGRLGAAPAKSAAATQAMSPAPVYAVGDVHGRDDLLGRLIAAIEVDAAELGDERATLVFLGDLVDRGPRSREVVERVLRLKADGRFDVEVLSHSP